MIGEYPGQKLTKEGRHHAEIALVPLLRGVLVDVDFTSSTTAQAVHGLDRPYRGAIPVASTEPSAYVGALDPETASRAGTDIRTRIDFATASSWTGTVTFWVF